MDRDDPSMSALLDPLISADDVLRSIRDEEIPNIVSILQQQSQALESIAGAVSDGDTSRSDAFTFGYSATVPANTSTIDPVEVERDMPFDGRLTQLVVSFPSGTQQAVGVQVARADDEQLAPRGESGYIALDGGFQPFDLRVNVANGETIKARFANNDPQTDHYAAVFLTVEERVGGNP